MKIDDALFDKLAHLSKLKFNDEEKKSIKEDLQNMIGLIDKMNEADTDGVEPLLHILPTRNILRPDEVGGQVSTNEALKNAPDHSGNYFRVPKVINKPK